MHLDNQPQWNKVQTGFYEVWYLKLNLTSKEALWLRFTTLSLKSGLKKVTEVWGIFFDPNTLIANQIKKIAIKNTCSLSSYQFDSKKIAIEDCIFSENHTSGSIVSHGHRIEWDFNFTPNAKTFFHVPQILHTLKLTKSTVCKPNVDIYFSGAFSVDEKKYTFENAPGCQGHIWGSKYANDWSWAHCNSFDESGIVVEMLTARVKAGGLILSPKMSALFVGIGEEKFEFNHLLDSLTLNSNSTLTDWKMSAEKGSVRFQIDITSTTRDFIGVTYETTDGNLLYCNNTALANMTLSYYKNGKLQKSYTSKNTTSFETVSSQKSPYIEVLL